ncbi:YcjF family protein [Pelagibacterium montanilacus]|uniref:YcjF family protein n=1 Tax=Pelagibacterium montanilacus TaxID=2185280 RepID=UPI000F8D8543|nr:TIGR01620 family protein [Pelagibacterium montanilacus]
MREPRAIPTAQQRPADAAPRAPRAFGAAQADLTEYDFAAEDPLGTDEAVVPPPPRRGRFWRTLALGTGGALVMAGLGLAAERLVADLFARHEWLGWAGSALLAVFLVALAVLLVREILGILRLKVLDRLRDRASAVLASDDLAGGKAVLAELDALYGARPDLARARTQLAADATDRFDGAELIGMAERDLMAPLDARAKALTAASARRVALVTAVSPRALIDIAYVLFESVRLARGLADLYGARPGFLGFVRLAGSILSHLAVTGGLVLTDGAVEQLLGQGLATKLSARLGEGVVNGLMTVRVGIAAMRVVRPLPFHARPAPVVTDFIKDLLSVATSARKPR